MKFWNFSRRKTLWALLVPILTLFVVPAFPVVKQRYSGNLKVAEELLSAIHSLPLFVPGQDAPVPVFPIPYQIKDSVLTLDFSFLPADRQTQIEKAVVEMAEISSRCHWLLDYPYYSHEHLNSISFEHGTLIVKDSDPDFLQTSMLSSCLAGSEVSDLMPFRKTQFGWEANASSPGGRPFLDSITPVPVDPLNPYLSFKLNDVDVFLVPEERFQQISGDPQLTFLSGPVYYLYLKTSGLSPEAVASLKGAIQAKELSQAVLNDHAEVLSSFSQESNNAAKPPLTLLVPEENPFRLLGERLRIQLAEAGFPLVPAEAKGNRVELAVMQVQEADLDIFRYLLLKEEFKVRGGISWFEAWDELEASGQLIPLLLYRQHIAVRKNVLDVQSISGMPDFSNCWILQAP